MYLSSLIGSDAKPYLEYAWVCAPNATGQSIATNTITTLYLGPDGTGEIADTGNYGSLSAGTFPTGTASATSQITLSAGTYYFVGRLGNIYLAAGAYSSGGNISLYNNTSASYITRKEFLQANSYAAVEFQGQFTISAQSVLEMRIYHTENANRTLTIGGGYYAGNSTISTANADQRTTIKLWKLA